MQIPCPKKSKRIPKQDVYGHIIANKSLRIASTTKCKMILFVSVTFSVAACLMANGVKVGFHVNLKGNVHLLTCY